MTVVLDSWAILRYLEAAEPAAGAVAELLAAQRPVVSWMNLGDAGALHARMVRLVARMRA